ncbi:hypothetical protein HK096_008490 [Nowakowskiella sp. JEL0078]|nr:hypothetical protein HK096_008490 [Nowakowskiella sp. JEL0078]
MSIRRRGFSPCIIILSESDFVKLAGFHTNHLERFVFITKESKGVFPHKFASPYNLNYVGPTPNISFYNNISLDVYNSLVEPNWSFKDTLLNYLYHDCYSLWNIIDKFVGQIFIDHGIHILKYSTLPAIAYAILRTNHLQPNTIVSLHGKVDSDIRNSFFGGIVDVYKPTGTDLYYYDVNSLYPASMMLDMPVGNPTFFDSDISFSDSNIFGFFYVTVITPSDLHIAPLPRFLNGKLVCQLGSWSGWYFSEELRDVINNYGYIIIPHYGYNFSRGKVFTSYVNHFYDIKSSTTDKVERFIAKLMLNSVYGRTGLLPELSDIHVLAQDSPELAALSVNPNLRITNSIELSSGKVILNVSSTTDINYNPFNSNVALASAITAYSRININKYKYIPNNPAYYSDTDSIVLAKPLKEGPRYSSFAKDK